RTVVAYLEYEHLAVGALAPHLEANPGGRGFQSVVQHVADHLLEPGVGNDRDVRVGVAAVVEGNYRAGSAPLVDQPVEERGQGGRSGRLAARVARREQDAGDDGVAAAELGLHFVQVLLQVGV